MHKHERNILKRKKVSGTEVSYCIDDVEFVAVVTYMSVGDKGNFYEPPEGDELEFELYDSEGNEYICSSAESDTHSSIIWDLLIDSEDRAKYDY